jgi:hypothetical protein
MASHWKKKILGVFEEKVAGGYDVPADADQRRGVVVETLAKLETLVRAAQDWER